MKTQNKNQEEMKKEKTLFWIVLSKLKFLLYLGVGLYILFTILFK